MALFKINRGSVKNLPKTKTEGYMYITEDVGDIYVDLSTSKRIRLNSESAEKVRKIIYNADGSYKSEASLNYDDLKEAVDKAQYLIGITGNVQTQLDSKVSFAEQTLSDEQKAQARENIGATKRLEPCTIAIPDDREEVPMGFASGMAIFQIPLTDILPLLVEIEENNLSDGIPMVAIDFGTVFGNWNIALTGYVKTEMGLWQQNSENGMALTWPFTALAIGNDDTMMPIQGMVLVDLSSIDPENNSITALLIFSLLQTMVMPSDADGADSALDQYVGFTDQGMLTAYYKDWYTRNEMDTKLDGKQNTITGAATSIVNNNLTANRALVSNGSGKVAASAVTSTELGYLGGVTSKVQDQLDSKQATITGAATTVVSNDLTADKVAISNTDGKLAVSNISTAELEHLSGVTASIQTQIDGKAPTEHTHKATDIVSGTLASNCLPTVPIAKGGTGATTAAGALTNLGLTATATELNIMHGVTATTAEINHLDGVTGNIQTQLNGKQGTIIGAATTITSDNLDISKALVSDANGKVAASGVTSTELGYLSGTTSAIQTQLNSKQATITGGATTITDDDLTANRALISNASGKVEVSDVTSAELAYLDGVTSNIQTQLDGKAPSSHSHDLSQITNTDYPDIDIFTNHATLEDIVMTTDVELVDIKTRVATLAGRFSNDAAKKANKLANARKITLEGDVTGEVSFDGSKNVSITTVVNDNSHNHSAGDIATGTLAIVRGGTGAGTAEAARTNLAVYSKTEVDNKVSGLKDDLLNGASGAYDTLKELGDLIDDNTDAIDALETVAAGKADAVHEHGNITNAGAIGTEADQAIITGTDGVLTTGIVSVRSGGTGAITAADALKNFGLDATAEELNIMHGVTASTAEFNLLDGVTATTAEINHLGGVTSSIQTQLDGKAPTVHPHKAADITSGTLSSDRLPVVPIAKGGTGASTATAALTNLGLTATAAELNIMDGVTATTTELNYVDGVTGNIQVQLDGKSNTDHKHSASDITSGTLPIKRGGTGLTSSPSMLVNLASTTADTVLEATPRPGVTGTLPIANGGTGATTAAEALTKLGLTATATELNYVDGVTSNIQTQLDGKLATTGTAAATTKLATARTIDGVSFDGSAAITHYGTCSTAADTAAKTVSLTGFTLVTGAKVAVKFTVTNSAANPTLNVNSTGAKAIYYKNAAISTSYLKANYIYEFIYDGTNYILVGDIDTNTTYTPAKLGSGYGTCSTAAATVAKTATLSSYTITTGGIVSIKFTNAVPANATLNVNSKGAKSIYYNNAAIKDGVIKAGDVATFIYSTQYHLISIDSPIHLDTWDDSSAPTVSEPIASMTLNSVKDEATYQAMKSAGKLKANELYLVQSDGGGTPTFSVQTLTLTSGATNAQDNSGLLRNNNPLVFYNGILMIPSVNYTVDTSVAAPAAKIVLSDFTAEANDVITLVGLVMN